MLGSHTPEALRNFIAGFCAVATSQVIGNPIDVLANRVMASGRKGAQQPGPASPASTAAHVEHAVHTQASSAFNYRNVGLFNGGAFRAVKHIIAVDGWRGLMHGYWASVALHAPTSGLWWAIYGVWMGTVCSALWCCGCCALQCAVLLAFCAAVTRPRAMAFVPHNDAHTYLYQRGAEMVCGVSTCSLSGL